MNSALFGTFADLLLVAPAPPKVRAAAFAALAALPGVRNRGEATDAHGRRGVRIEIGGGSSMATWLIIDRSADLVLASGYSGTADTPPNKTPGEMVVLRAGWTDETPTPPRAP